MIGRNKPTGQNVIKVERCKSNSEQICSPYQKCDSNFAWYRKSTPHLVKGHALESYHPSNTFQTGAFVRIYTLVVMDRSGPTRKRLGCFVLQPQTSLRLVFVSRGWYLFIRGC